MFLKILRKKIDCFIYDTMILFFQEWPDQDSNPVPEWQIETIDEEPPDIIIDNDMTPNLAFARLQHKQGEKNKNVYFQIFRVSHCFFPRIALFILDFQIHCAYSASLGLVWQLVLRNAFLSLFFRVANFCTQQFQLGKQGLFDQQAKILHFLSVAIS